MGINRILNEYKIPIIIFLVAIASGFFWNQKIFGQIIPGADPLFDCVAQDLVYRGSFTCQGEDTFAEPLYPLFLAVIYKIFGVDYDIVRVIQIIIFSATAIFVYLIARQFFSFNFAAFTALMTAVFYGLANQAGLIMTETIFTFLIVITVYYAYKAALEDKNIYWCIAGVSLGLATLTRGIVQFLFIFFAINVFIYYYRKLGFSGSILKSGIIVLSFVIVVLPWITLGSASGSVSPRGGRVLFSRTGWMERLYPHYSAHLVGHLFGYYFSQKFDFEVKSSDFRDDPEQEQKVREFRSAGKSQGEINDVLLEQAKGRILKAPHKYILVSVLDFISLNSPIIPSGSLWQNTAIIHPMFAEGRHPEISGAFKTAIILGLRFTWFAFMFLTIYGVIKSIKSPENNGLGWGKIGWIILVILYFNLAYSAVHAIPRYALPIYPFYVILAIVGIGRFFNLKWLFFQESKISEF